VKQVVVVLQYDYYKQGLAKAVFWKGELQRATPELLEKTTISRKSVLYSTQVSFRY